MNSPAHGDVSIIVRECGERTADACVGLITELFGEVPHRVSGRPFQATLRQSLELGLRLGRAWTLCIDADVLVLPAIRDFLEQARHLPPATFEAQALVLDKLLTIRRPAGNHLYRTALIERALPLIPDARSMRPESDMILAMAALGYSNHQSALVVGLHDFEQSFQDIYKKAFLHGHKHDYLIPQFQPIWEMLGKTDEDFRIALVALDGTRRQAQMPEICRDYRDAESLAALAGLGLLPKAPLDRIVAADVRRIARFHEDLDPVSRHRVEVFQAQIDEAIFPTPKSAASGAPVGWMGIAGAVARRAARRLANGLRRASSGRHRLK